MSVAAACVDFSNLDACFPRDPLFHHLLRDFILRRWHNHHQFENPPVEITPGFAHESCKDSGEAAIGEIHWGKEDGLAPCTFPALCNYDC